MLRTVSPDWTTVGRRRASHARGHFRHRGRVAYLGGMAVRAVLFWMERSRQRRALAGLDDRLLRDVGLTRDEARRECANPFWKA
jgi:uncharacterized protein YjiS (DUF1127 family)